VSLDTSSRAAAIGGTGTVSGGSLERLGIGDFALLRLSAAQRLFEKPGRVDAMFVTVAPGRRAAVAAALGRRVGGRALVARPGTVTHDFLRVFDPLRTLSSLAAVAALFVAALLVYNMLATSVTQRRRELGTLVAFGVRRSQTATAFVIEALVLGAAASIVGVGAGVLLGSALVDTLDYGRFMLGDVVTDVRATRLALGVGAGLGVTLVGALATLRRVLRCAPAQTMRPSGAQEPVGDDTAGSRRARYVLAAIAAAAAVALLIAEPTPGQSRLAELTLAAWLVVIVVALRPAVTVGVRVARFAVARLLGPMGRLALDGLVRNSGRTALSVGGIAVSAGLVVAVTASHESYRSSLDGKARSTFGAPVYVAPGRERLTNVDPPLPGRLVRRLAHIPGVRAAYPQRRILIEAGGEPAVLIASPVAEASRAGVKPDLIGVGDEQRRFAAALGAGAVAISSSASQHLDLHVGDRIALATPRGRRRLRVGMVWDDLVNFNQVYVGDDTYRRLWRDTAASDIALFPDPGVSPAALVERAKGAVGAAGVRARVRERDRVVDEILDRADGAFSFGRATQLACVLVAALAVANTMFMSVAERRWEFALQRTLGMSKGGLVTSLLVEAAAVGSLGGSGAALFGTATGYVMTRSMNAGYGWQVDFSLPLVTIVAVAAGAIALAALAAMPALRVALRVPMVDAMREEIDGYRVRGFALQVTRSGSSAPAGGARAPRAAGLAPRR
jgi:putative ABC transport system permease protein